MALTDNIVSYWKLDESSGNAVDATASNITLVNNGTIAYTTGKINNGANLAHTDSKYFSVANASQGALKFTSDFTINMWVKWTSLLTNDGNESEFWYNGSGDPNRSYFCNAANESGSQYLRMYCSATGTGAVGLNQLWSGVTTGTWYMVTFVYTHSSKQEIFVNGTSIGSNTTSVPASIHASISNLGVGGVSGGSHTSGDNILDEIGAWSRALSGSEITSLYNSGTGLQYPFTPSTSIKTFNGLAYASVKTVDGLAIASVKTIEGLA